MTPDQQVLRTELENQMQALQLKLESVKIELDIVREKLALIYWPQKGIELC